MVPIDKCVTMCRPGRVDQAAAEGVQTLKKEETLTGESLRKATASGRVRRAAVFGAVLVFSKVTFCLTLFSLSVRKFNPIQHIAPLVAFLGSQNGTGNKRCLPW